MIQLYKYNNQRIKYTAFTLVWSLLLSTSTVFSADNPSTPAQLRPIEQQSSIDISGIPETASDKEELIPSKVYVSSTMAPRLQRALKSILQSPDIEGADVSFMVKDLDSEEVVASMTPTSLINPASNAKLLTTASALELLGTKFRWKTEYYFTGELENGVLDGDLAIKGYGDPTVVTERLQAVVDRLYKKGLRKIKGQIIVDNSYFDRNEEARGWDLEGQKDRAYAAPVNALSFNYNALAVNLIPGKRGEKATVLLDLPLDAVEVENSVTTAKYIRRLRLSTAVEKRHKSKVIFSGKVGYRDTARRFYRRIYEPHYYFASAMRYFLKQKGIKISKKQQLMNIPEDARLVLVDQSAALGEVLGTLNHYSNNFIAETIVKTIAAETISTPGSFDKGLRVMRQFLEDKVGFKSADYVYGNGSGLNDVNRISAQGINTLLSYMYRNEQFAPEFMASLAVAGTQGTIHHRMKNGPAKRRLRAKTGTLSKVSALSGYVVDPRNNHYIFSILIQKYPRKVRVRQIWDIQNQIGEALASDGESWVDPSETIEKSPLVLNLLTPSQQAKMGP